MKKHLTMRLSILLAASMLLIASCKKEDVLDIISGFSFKVDATDFRKVTFTNASQNYSSVSWDFGDNTAASTEVNPVHTYAGVGTYTVKLTATASDGRTDVSTQVVGIADPNGELTKLVGSANKTWKLLRSVAPGRWPLEVGPITKDQVWWGMGRDNDEIALRPCIMNDEFTFGRDGSFKYDTKGDFWAEGGVFDATVNNLCQTTSAANLIGTGGTDLSAFGDGNHTFTLTNGAKQTLTVSGLGAFVGLCKIGTDKEVSTPQTSVTYDVIKMTDGVVDTLILQSEWKFQNNTSGTDDAYWRITLVHYDNPADEPAQPSPKPIAGFTAVVDALSISFTNTSKYAASYSWDFGDGATSSQESPSHTYGAPGIYKVKLTATNTAGTGTSEQEFTLSAGPMTEANLVGGAWQVRKEALSIFVGPGLGNSSWWNTPLNFLDGSSSGTDDWSCITNDEFIFSAGGVYQYKTNGDARNDGYMGTPNGCWSDAQVAASGNGAAFGSATHSFTFTPASGTDRPIITLTNGASGAAFLGFYKGYYGGENGSSANPPNGGATTNRYEVMSYIKEASGRETMVVSVDISGAKDGSSAWSVVLVRN
jgi:PKD repeat protein